MCYNAWERKNNEEIIMTHERYQSYLNILKKELIPAMGCTEPIAIAYAAALARKTLGFLPEKVTVKASANIIKNVKSVVVPNTGGRRGIAVAAVAGIVAGNADAKLEVISEVSETQHQEIDAFLSGVGCEVEQSDKPYIFDIQVEVLGQGHCAYVEIAGEHTNVICISRDSEIVLCEPYEECMTEPTEQIDTSVLTVEGIIEFADRVNLEEVRDVLRRQIDCNWAIAEEGMRSAWGAQIGNTLLQAYGDTVHNRAKAYAAAGSDARMNGCELPVIINSGSGNQGLTTSLPVIVYAKELKASEEELYRALVVANLVTIHLKTDIGRLSAYCGATSAGCGAGAGICYLHGGKAYEVSHTIVNAVAINSGMVCDGAKASCAAKIASAVEAGLLGWQMQRNGTQFYGGEGIVTKGVENTIRNVGRMARLGMAETDREIIRIMMEDKEGC